MVARIGWPSVVLCALPLVPTQSRLLLLLRRSAILMLMTVAASGTYLLENPANSLICMHDAYIWLVKTLLAAGVKAGLTQLCFVDDLVRSWGFLSYIGYISGVMF